MSAKHLPLMNRRRMLGTSAVALVAAATAACSAPGSGGASAEGSAPEAVSTTLPTEPVKIRIMTSTEAADAVTALGEAFTAQHNTVTFEITAEANATLAQNISRILTRNDPPELCFMPALSAAAKDKIVTNMDPYAEAYGWDSWSQPLLAIARMDDSGQRGVGSLYAVGIGYNVTGIFYNKELASELGVTMPPATVDEFDAACAAAVAAGKKAIAMAGKDVGTPYLLQMLQNAYGDSQEINDWIFQKSGATFVQPAMIEAATKIQEWVGNGVIPSDAVSVDYSTSMADFQAGDALFVPNGDWEAQRLASVMGDKVGFFLFPGAQAGADLKAMASPANYVIPATAANKDVTAYFLNWIHTDESARQMVVDAIGCSPGGPTDLPVPTSDVQLVQETTQAFNTVLESGGAVDFIANATPGIGMGVMTPECQALLLGKTTPEEFAQAIQDGYEQELNG
ncbi:MULTISPECIES: ABC transporter substrate-binding protein [unclassified Actinomyces]|uniref:ABC transporter substrate-binding protein n=1 Tax=unclassified Actinomyces TaxID=2609248 RepID=UPI0011BEC21D|nr:MULTISPECIES: extracellular solute-binding protein [unclassified Actinomyces]